MFKFTRLLTLSSFALIASAQPTFAEWQNVDGANITNSRQTFDRVNRQFKVNVTVSNPSNTDLVGPLRLLVDNATLASANMSGVTEDGVPYLSLASGLAAGETRTVQLAFEYARTRLNFDLSLEQDAQEQSDWTLVWQDEFEGSEVDDTKWSFEENCWGGGNNEQQCYTNRAVNSFVENGKLTILAQQETFTGPDNPNGDTSSLATLPYTSARLRTLNKAEWTYGRFEINAKLPAGQGTWPAIWMLPTDYVYGTWAASGEIDIMEAVNLKAQSDAPGAEPGDLEDRTHGTLHYGRIWPGNVSSGTDYAIPSGVNPADGFHEYAIEWEDGEIRWYVDDVHYATQTSDGWYSQYQDEDGVWITGEGSAPFNERFHLLLNVAVGGAWASNVNEKGIDSSVFPQTMEIDYVRVYECSINPSTGQGCATIGENAELVPGNQAPVIRDPSDNVGKGPVFNLFTNSLIEALSFESYNPNGSVSFEVQEDTPDRGNVVVLEQSGSVGNMFFGASPAINMSEFAEYGQLVFDIKAIENGAGSDVLVKFDSGWPAVSDARITPTSAWQTMRLSVPDMLSTGNSLAPGNTADIVDISNPFVVEPTGPITLALDNVRYEFGLDGINEVVVFDDRDHAPFSIGSFVANGSVEIEQVVSADASHGEVKQLTFNTNESVVYFQTQADNGGTTVKLDMNSLDMLEFDILVIEDPRDTRNFVIKMDCGFPCGSGDYPIETPEIGVWKSYQIPLADLISHGGSSLNLATVDTPLVIFPAWGNQQGVVMQVDNVRVVGDGNDDNNPPNEVVIDSDTVLFDDAFAPGWALWDCCGNANVSIVADAERGMVANVDFFGPSPTVSGMQASLPHNLAAAVNGTLEFDFKLASAPNDETAQLLIKFETSNGTFLEMAMSESVEGLAPQVGQWQHFTFNVGELQQRGIDIEKLNLILMFPSWTKAQGAVYQLDNVEVRL